MTISQKTTRAPSNPARRAVPVVAAMLVCLLSVVGVGASVTPVGAAGTGDDYPTNLKNAAKDALIDPWLFYNRECVSFVAWRLNQQGGTPTAPWSFQNNMTGPNGVAVHFGNGYEWLAAAKKGGWTVDHTPTVGAVAYWGPYEGGASSLGHVAIVASVNADKTANIEEYNYGVSGAYHQRSSVTATWYLHIQDQGTPTDQQRTDSIRRLYLAYFLRQPDASGLAYWFGVSKAGKRLPWISSAFAGSSEFINRYGALDSGGFVDLIYENVLGRAADASGRAYWVNVLDSGTTRGAVMIGFSESSEFVRKTGTVSPA